MVVFESFSGKSHGGHLQLHPTLPRDKELEGLLPNVGGVKALSDLGGNGRLSYAEVVRTAEINSASEALVRGNGPLDEDHLVADFLPG